ncbi:MAG: gliding motility-associated C-terminal domain-containing protein, partial [Bacteroidetes bacterium]
DCDIPVYFPNIFSPNGDGINDTFFGQGTDFEPLRLVIYDRWGGRVYEGSGNWDGTASGEAAPAGVYVYEFEYFNLRKNAAEKIRGDVALVR